VLLLSTLGVVSCATVIERRLAPETVSEAVPLPQLDASSQPRLLLPVKGLGAADVKDNFYSRRGGRVHKALDIMARRGTLVVAAGDGVIARVYRHPLGGLCVYQYDAQREYAYYYAHLDGYAAGIREGLALRRGDAIGYVGTTGNATPTSPHLHFALIKLGPERTWYKGIAVNPYPYLVGPAA
jgi:murein DD-endopeptidase MepM/ murein hydrolase activator NlpD